MRRLFLLVVVLGVWIVVVRAQTAVTVDFTTVHQTMAGFGASDAFNIALSDANADLFFSPTAGIGLSFLRVGITSTGGNFGTWADATKAAARGASVWAAPWTAPANYKDNNDLNNGGHLLSARYNDWANTLAGFQATLQSNAGVNLYGLSIQNEPDFSAPYVSMLYTPQEMLDFAKVLGPKLAALSPQPVMMLPDVANWGGAWSYTSPILADGVAAPYLGLIIVHQYAGVSSPGTSARPIWETEMSSFESFDPSIANGITVAGWIYDALVTGNAAAWHYWNLIAYNSDNEGLTGHDNTFVLTKRLYTVGNYSKFVRPGFQRVDVSGAPGGTQITGFKNTGTGGLVIVAVNTTGGGVPITFTLNGLTANTMVPYVTSSTLDLAAQSAITVSSSAFTATLAASSVTTFVGTPVTPPPPIVSRGFGLLGVGK